MSAAEVNVRPDLDLKIVGQIISALGVVHVFPTEPALASFLGNLLRGVPGCQSVRFCFRNLARPLGDAPGETCLQCARSLDPRAEAGAYACGLVLPGLVRSYPLETGTGFYGHFIVTVAPESGYEAYEPLIRNLGNAVALLLENRAQQAALQAANENLEQRMEERTAELRQSLATAERARRAMLGALEDRQKAEAARQEIELRYRALIESSPDTILVQRGEQIIYANPAALKMLGAASAAVLVGKPMLDRIHPDFHHRALARRKLLVEQGVAAPLAHQRFVRLDGTTVEVEAQVTPIVYDRQPAIQVIARDITERLQAEAALRVSEANLNRAQATAHLGSWSWNVVSDIVLWSAEMYRIYGVMPETFAHTLEGVTKLVHPDDLPQYTRANEAYLRGEVLARWEYRAIRPDGGVRVLEVVSSEVDRDTSGQPYRVSGTVQDITERKQVEAALAQSEKRFRTMFEEAPLGVALIDSLTGHICEVNPKFAEISGRSVAEMAALDWMSITHPDDVQADLDNMARLNAGEIPGFDMNKRYRRPDGSYVWIHMTIAPMVVADRTQPRHLCMIEDITERKRVEAALTKVRLHYQSLLETASDGVHVVSLEGELIEASASFYRMLGYPPEHPPHLNVADWDAQWTPEELKGLIASLIAHPQVFETRHRRQNGETFEVEVNTQGIEIDGQRFLYASARDITERKRTEEALRSSATYSRSLVEASLDALVAISSEGKITDVNDASVQAIGIPRAQLIGTDFSDYFTEPAQARAGYQQVFQEGFVRDYPLSLRHVSGRVTEVLYNAAIYRDAQGQVLGVCATARDITERHRAEEALKQSRRLLAETEKVGKVGGWEFAIESGQQTWTEEVYHIHELDHTHQPMVEMGISYYVPTSRPIIERAVQRAIEQGEPFDLDLEIITAKGNRRAVHTVGRADLEQRRIYGFFQDITERKRAEAEIRELNASLEQRVRERTVQLTRANQELEAFSYSVSHDLRAPLRGMDGFVRMLQEDYGPRLDAEGNRLIGVVSREAKRMGRLIDDLLAFSRMSREHLAPTPVDMTGLARACFESVTRALPGPGPRFELPPLPPALGDAAMLRQVFENLLGNAVKFSRHQPAPVIQVGFTQDGEETTYYVTDNGAGFDEHYAHKLFGVFQRLHSETEFEGTGVGLALVQRIIHRHGGQVWASGTPGAGATFYFTLPTAKETSL